MSAETEYNRAIEDEFVAADLTPPDPGASYDEVRAALNRLICTAIEMDKGAQKADEQAEQNPSPQQEDGSA